MGNAAGNAMGNSVGNVVGNAAGNAVGNLVGNGWGNDAVFSLNMWLRTIYCLQSIHARAQNLVRNDVTSITVLRGVT